MDRTDPLALPPPPSVAAGFVPSGWYPQTPGSSVERWWDGSAWSSRTRAALEVDERPGPVVIKNTAATAGLALGALALVVNTFLVVSVAALVMSVRGLSRSGQLQTHGYGPVGRRRALGGAVLGVVAAVLTASVKSFLF
ncbi:DUF2510 domain-containing protein [Actinotalea sp. K2]|uniref:DUF2510 domain-containing protein n=1 Tax=Actinotalea sp. K2 TaxID=2939438 RepID=UPI00201739B3|nr:DUF2510 domain-containing protein [Actinotalea sp. K2]MCL3860768.1 DUF2510 domain-containing protein [Actinotalea sp. K2]